MKRIVIAATLALGLVLGTAATASAAVPPDPTATIPPPPTDQPVRETQGVDFKFCGEPKGNYVMRYEYDAEYVYVYDPDGYNENTDTYNPGYVREGKITADRRTFRPATTSECQRPKTRVKTTVKCAKKQATVRKTYYVYKTVTRDGVKHFTWQKKVKTHKRTATRAECRK
jgi:hypothetical protein